MAGRPVSRRLDPTDDQLEKWLADECAYRLRWSLDPAQLTDEDCKWDADSLTGDEDDQSCDN